MKGRWEGSLRKLNINEAIEKIAGDIIYRHKNDLDRVALLGILTRGIFIARRIKNIIEARSKTKINIPLGTIDVTFYRDDVDSLSIAKQHPVKETKIEFDITARIIILVDDVLYTGRSIRAALDEIIDFGRPAKVELAVIVDRGGRELPIQPDYVGSVISLSEQEKTIRVHMKEIDGEDAIKIISSRKK